MKKLIKITVTEEQALFLAACNNLGSFIVFRMGEDNVKDAVDHLLEIYHDKTVNDDDVYTLATIFHKLSIEME